jgi:HEPN domain-containing protein
MIAARYMFYNVNPKQTEISVFHCQQCAEKALKAYLVAHELDPPKIHDLLILSTESDKGQESGELEGEKKNDAK